MFLRVISFNIYKKILKNIISYHHMCRGHYYSTCQYKCHTYIQYSLYYNYIVHLVLSIQYHLTLAYCIYNLNAIIKNIEYQWLMGNYKIHLFFHEIFICLHIFSVHITYIIDYPKHIYFKPTIACNRHCVILIVSANTFITFLSFITHVTSTISFW